MIIEFLKNNLGTIAVFSIVALIVIFLTVKLIKDKRAGKSGCSCGCSACPMSSECKSKK